MGSATEDMIMRPRDERRVGGSCFLGLIVLAVVLPKASWPAPLLEFQFNDVVGSTVPNHGTLAAAGDATLGTNTTVGSGTVPFRYNSHLTIDQSGDQMSAADLDAIDTANDLTVSFFVRPTATLADWRDMLGDFQVATVGSGVGWHLYTLANGGVRFRPWAGDATQIAVFDSSPGQLTAGQWTHIALVAKNLQQAGSHTVSVDFYRDGEYQTTANATTSKTMGNNTSGFLVGNHSWDPEAMAQYGVVAVFDTALSPQQVRTYYQDSLLMPTPVLWYRFNDVNGTTVPNHGTLGATGNATLGANTTVAGGETAFRDGSYLVVDQAGDLMAAPEIDSIDAMDKFTLAFFVKPTATYGDWMDLMGDFDVVSGNGKGWNLQAMSNQRARLRLWATDNSWIGDFDSPAGLIVPNQWQHIAVVAQNLVQPGSHTVLVDFYRNGQYVSTASAATTKQMGNGGSGFKLGNAMWDPELMAFYGDVALFGTALSAEQVRQYYESLLPEPNCLVLVGLAVLGLWPWVRRRRQGEPPRA